MTVLERMVALRDFLGDCDLSPSERLFLWALVSRCDEQWKCYPSQQLLSRETGLSESTLSRVRKSLESRNLLTVTNRNRGNDRQSNVYAVSIPSSHGDSSVEKLGQKKKPNRHGATSHSDSQKSTTTKARQRKKNRSVTVKVREPKKWDRYFSALEDLKDEGRTTPKGLMLRFPELSQAEAWKVCESWKQR